MGINSAFMDKTSTILKQDRLGRVRSTKERRAAVVSEYQRSGLAAREFAKLAGIHYNTFWNWLSENGLTAKRAKGASERTLRLVEVAMPRPSAQPIAAGAVVIRMGKGMEVQLLTAEQVPLVVALIKALNPGSPC
jgi:transposase-like protein